MSCRCRALGAAVLFLSTLVAAPVVAPAQPAAPDAYLNDLDDVPLMPGLAEVAGAGLVFDQPSGRIVEAYATGDVTPEAVRGFYAATLPALGWSPTVDGAFRRETEVLRLDFQGQAGGAVTVRFALSPGRS